MDLKYYKQFCANIENVENFEKAKADNFKNWCCHHRLQTWTSDGERRLVDISAAELIALGMYYDRPAEELIFLTKSEHSALHNKAKKGKKLSDEHKKKISEAWDYEKVFTEETRKKIAKANKGHIVSKETRNKIAEAAKGNTKTKDMHWYNNGVINTMSKECPDGFVPGMLRK